MHLSAWASTPRDATFSDTGQILETGGKVRRGSAASAAEAEKAAIVQRAALTQKEHATQRPSPLMRCMRRIDCGLLSCLDSPYLPPAAVTSRKFAVLVLGAGLVSACAGFGSTLVPMLSPPLTDTLTLRVFATLLPDALVSHDGSGLGDEVALHGHAFDRPRNRLAWGTAGVLDVVGALAVLCAGRYHTAPGEGAMQQGTCLLLLVLALGLHGMVVAEIFTALADLAELKSTACAEAVASARCTLPYNGGVTDSWHAALPIATTALVLNAELVQLYYCDRARVALLSPPAGGQRGSSALV